MVAAAKICPFDHERIKWTRAWDDLVFVGVQSSGDSNEPDLELRNCTCGSTLCKPVPRVERESAQVVDVPLDMTDALAVGQTMRSMARDRTKFMPEGVRELFAKVGSQMTSAARLALANKAGS